EQIINRMKSAQQNNLTLANQPEPAATDSATPQSNDNPQTQLSYWFLNQGNMNNITNPMNTANQTGTIVTPDPAAIQQQSVGLVLQPLAPQGGPLSEEELL